MNTTTSLTLAEAASGTGIVKSSILSAIKSCRLSYTRGEFGQLRIEAAELHRELAETSARLSLAEHRVADLTKILDDMREQRDRWQAQADRLSSALTDQPRKATRWWRWRRSTRDDALPQITHVRDNPRNVKSDCEHPQFAILNCDAGRDLSFRCAYSPVRGATLARYD